MRRGDMPEAVGDTLCVPIFFEIAFTFKRPLLSQRLVGWQVGDWVTRQLDKMAGEVWWDDGPTGLFEMTRWRDR